MTAKHFKNEEQYMESIKFPYIKYHAEVHLKILNKIIIVLNNKEPYSYIMQKYYIKTIDDTLLKHIDEHDRQISEYLKTITLIKP